jgi:hypothetical protein
VISIPSADFTPMMISKNPGTKAAASLDQMGIHHAVTAAPFRLLRQPSRPSAATPVEKSGRAAGSGTDSTSDKNVAV